MDKFGKAGPYWGVTITIGLDGLHAPHEVAFAMRSWPLLTLTIALLSFSLRLLLLTHFGGTPEAENLFPPIFWHN